LCFDLGTKKAAAILRRASPLAAKEPRVSSSMFASHQLFDNNPVLPIVAHIIDVTHFPHALGQQR
jgi:hypothetical protein